MTLPEILAEIETKHQEIRDLRASVELKETQLQGFIGENLSVDPSGPVTINGVVRLIEKVLDLRGVK